MKIEHLTWDSEFFDKKIGKITCNSAEVERELNSLLSEAKEQCYQLLSVFTCNGLIISESLLNKYNGKLIDRKVLYYKSIQTIDKEPIKTPEYTQPFVTKELETLSYLSGKFSRFRLDTGFKQDDFYRLYNSWITKSISKEIADKVFVVYESENIIGMVTLKFKHAVGEIGLIAVSETAQGKGYGKKLIQACTQTLINEGIYQIEVATQIENIPACRFYEKCGFIVKSITNIYHFWL